MRGTKLRKSEWVTNAVQKPGIAVDRAKPLVACRLVSVLFDLGVRSAGTSERRAEAYYKSEPKGRERQAVRSALGAECFALVGEGATRERICVREVWSKRSVKETIIGMGL